MDILAILAKVVNFSRRSITDTHSDATWTFGAGGRPTLASRRWGTLYNRVGVVKRHVDLRGFCFSLPGDFGLLLLITKARFQNPAVDFSVPPAIYSVINFRS